MSTFDFLVVIGAVGSIASIIGLLIATPTWDSRLIHVGYAFFIAILTAGVVTYQHRIEDSEKKIREMQRIEHDAVTLLTGFDFSTSGSMSGFMLAALSFLEKHKDRLPETYKRAEQLCESSNCLMKDPNERASSMTHFNNLQEASTAMKYLVQGISKSGGE